MLVHSSNIQEVEVRRIEMQKPENAGKVWKGIPNADLLDAFHTVTAERGWTLGMGSFSVSSTLQGLAGAWDIAIPDLNAPQNQSFSLGFITSNDMTRSLRIVAGSRVFVCNNGMAVKERHLKFRNSDAVLMQAGRKGIMGWSNIGKVDAEFRKPSFDYDRAHKTYWGLYNAFTHIVKGYNGQSQMDKMNQFRALLPMADAA